MEKKKDKIEYANDLGVFLPHYELGEHRIICPNCSSQRNKKYDKCLHRYWINLRNFDSNMYLSKLIKNWFYENIFLGSNILWFVLFHNLWMFFKNIL